MHLCVEVCGSDKRMDSRNECHEALNPLPEKCSRCGFPDLDFIPQPYFVQRGRAMQKNEMAEAEHGHFFVRKRVRRIIELAAPGQCEFYSTQFQKTEETTPWTLVAPRFRHRTASHDATLRLCRECAQPRGLHPGTDYVEWVHRFASEHDILTSSNWYGWRGGASTLQWRDRHVCFSVRFLTLLHALKAKGFCEASIFDKEIGEFEPASEPTAEDTEWVKEKLREIEAAGISLLPAGKVSSDDARWFRRYLKENKANDISYSIEPKAAKKQAGFLLPKTYCDFINQVGPRAFDNVDQLEGFRVSVLLPEGFDAKSHRRHEQNNSAVDGVMFADTDHGDCFCFDVQADREEYEIYMYDHELDVLEHYAADFAAFVRRIAGTEADD